MKVIICVAAVMLFGLAGGTVLYGADSAKRFIKRSDVVFMGPKDAEIYKVYGATVVSWGGRPWGDSEKAIERHRARVKLSHDLGIRHCGGAAFRTAFAGMIEFDQNFMDSVCRRIDGEPILVPWLWDHKHKGHPAYWFCTNSPGYRKYLRHQVKLIMTADVDGLHIDDYNGTAGTEWQGGCFCKYCMEAFREYIKKNVPAKRLKRCGIDSPENFDYGEFLRAKGIKTVNDFKRILKSPEHLGPDYLTFQYKAAGEFVNEIRKYAEGLVGHPLMLSVNSSCSGAKSLLIAPYLTYFCGEVHHGAERPGWDRDREWNLEPVWTFKLADAVNRPQCCTGSGGDWAYMAEHNKPGLVRMWITQDYAFGHCLMVPHKQWAYTKAKGTHWYQSKPEDYAHIYRFVRRNADLFDGYEAVALVGLLYSNAADRATGSRVARKACAWLTKNNVPFEIVPAGDDWLNVKLTPEKLAKYRVLIVCEPTMLDGEQQKVLDRFAAAGKVLKWDPKSGINEAALRECLPRQITIDGAENVIAVARTNPARPDAPAILHLLNRNYREEYDCMEQQLNIRVKLHKDLFGGRTLMTATLYSPPSGLDPENPGAGQPIELESRLLKDGVLITIPELDLWGIVKLEK